MLTSTRKMGVALYLREGRQLRAEEVRLDFEKRWPGVGITSEASQQHTLFVVANSRLTLELRNSRIPDDVTAEALRHNRHWANASEQLVPHTAHIAIAANVDPSNALSSASDLTRLASSVLALSNSIGVCWLNGPVLNSKQDFIAISQELTGAGVLPLVLWLAVHWDPASGLIYTTGMDQFGRPDLFLAQQSKPNNVEYLFDLANYALTSGNELLDGETIDGPDGVLRIQELERSYKTGKRGLMLFPMQPN
jgi:Domain of unknown function (DUF4261)